MPRCLSPDSPRNTRHTTWASRGASSPVPARAYRTVRNTSANVIASTMPPTSGSNQSCMACLRKRISALRSAACVPAHGRADASDGFSRRRRSCRRASRAPTEISDLKVAVGAVAPQAASILGRSHRRAAAAQLDALAGVGERAAFELEDLDVLLEHVL